MISQRDAESRIEGMDVSLFDAIQSQSDNGDRRSWLALQRSVRAAKDGYTYLEIGSYLGGSIQQYLVDQKCHTIYSIDKRPLHPPDDRGGTVHYEDNSMERMLHNLESVDATQLHKLVCFDSDA